MKKPIYIPYKVRFWSGLNLSNPYMPVQQGIKPLPEFGIAFMPVFESLDELKKEYPDEPFFTGEIDTKEYAEG